MWHIMATWALITRCGGHVAGQWVWQPRGIINVEDEEPEETPKKKKEEKKKKKNIGKKQSGNFVWVRV